MNKPYVICHMMQSLDGRIDCAMTTKIHGGDQYFDILKSLNCDASLSGRGTAQLEMSLPGEFSCENPKEYGQCGFSKKQGYNHYDIVVDTKGKLLWRKANQDNPLLIITSENVSKEYLIYLDSLDISWIAVGQNHIDLEKGLDILYNQFDIKRLAIVGGGLINGGFLKQHLIDELSIILGPAIDGRTGQPALFDGIEIDDTYPLQLTSLKQYDDSTVALTYKVLKGE